MKKNALNIELITREFNAMLAELAAIDTSVQFRDVVDHEASKTVIGDKGAVIYTRAANASKIRENHAKRTHVKLADGKRYNPNWRLNAETWKKMKMARAISLDTKLGARGLAKQSWLITARKIGRPFTFATQYVYAANYKGRIYPEDVATSREGDGSRYAITVVNSSPMVSGAKMPRALAMAMGGRARYFRQNMAHHFWRTAASRAAKYPGIFTSPVPPRAD